MTENSQPRVAGLLLAAGGSSRLGRPKQLVEWQGKTLIRRAAEALIEAGCSPVVVVLGAEVDGSSHAVEGLGVEIVFNEDWESGMGSSVAVGMLSIMSVEPDAVLINLCDQPHVTGTKLRILLDTFADIRPPLIAAEYDGITGVPALFSKALFPQLLGLSGDKGARELIRNTPDAMTIALPEAAIDVDRKADLDAFD